MFADKAAKTAVEMRLKLFISIPNPNMSTPKYIG
jgi:hypothetical protein